MDLLHPINARTKKRHGKGFLFRFCVGCCLLLALLLTLIILAPTLLSKATTRNYVLAFVNTRIAPAQLSIEDWQWHWFQPQTIAGITYNDPKRNVYAEIPHVSLSSLFNLLPIGSIKADITIDQPHVKLPALATLIAPPTSDVVDTSSDEATSSATSSELPILPAWDIAAHLNIKGATVTLADLATPLVQEGEFNLHIEALDQPIATTLTAQIPNATLNAKATLSSLQQLVLTPPTIAHLQQAEVSLLGSWVNLSSTLKHTPEATLPNATLALALDMGQLFSAFRPLGLLPETLNSLSGKINLTAQTTAKEKDAYHLVSTVKSQDFACAYDGQTLLCAPEVELDVMLMPENLLASTAQKLSLTLPGLTAKGSGSLTNGTLQATLDATTFWATFHPFLGDYPLNAPLTLALSAKALTQNLTATLTAHHQQQTIGTLSLQADALNLSTQSLQSLKLNSHFNIEALRPFLPNLPQTLITRGDIYANLAATGSLHNLTADLLFACQNATLQSTTWTIHEPTLLKGNAKLKVCDGTLTLPLFALSSPIANLSGSLLPEASAPSRYNLDLTGILQPAKVFQSWCKWGKDETPFALNGTLTYTLSGVLHPTMAEGAFKLNSDDFTYLPQKGDPLPLPFNLDVGTHYKEACMTLTQATAKMDGLSLQSTGTYHLTNDILDLKGTLTPDFEQLFSTLPPLMNLRDTVALTGCHPCDFTLKAPLRNGLPGLINYGKGSAQLAFDTITLPGLKVPHGTLLAKLQDGVAAIDGDFTVNGGALHLRPRISYEGVTPVLTWENGEKVLENVQLTPELFDASVAALSPLLVGSAAPSGTISLTCEALRLPLAEQALQEIDATLVMETANCQLKPNDTVQKILKVLSKSEDAIRLEDQPFKINIENGILGTSPLSFRIEALKVTCEGQTTLATQAIDYRITVPLTKALLGRSLAKQVQSGKTVTLPIRGTISQPQIDTAPLAQVFSDVAVEKAKTKLSKKIDKILKKKAKTTQSQSEKRQQPTATDADALFEEALRGLFGD